MKQAKLTKRLVESLAPPDGGRVRVMDTAIPGFGIRVSKRSKAFVINYRANGKRVRDEVIGHFPPVTVEQARERARTLLSGVELGLVDTSRRRAKASAQLSSFSELCATFLERYSKPRRKTWRTDEARINRHLLPALGAKPALRVTRGDVLALHNRIGTTDCESIHCRVRRQRCDGHPVEANRNVTLIQRIFEVARDFELIPADHPNPAARFGDYAFKEEKKHDRSATADEVRRLRGAIATTGNPYVRAAFWLYLLTGLRKQEALRLRWDEVNLDTRGRVMLGRVKLPQGSALIPDNKSERPFVLPLAEPVRQLLASLPSRGGEWVLPAQSKRGHLVSVDRQWQRVRRLAGVPELTMHDLRATVASWASRRGEHDRLINAMLNQSPPGGVVTRYIDASPDRVREAFNAHAEEVLKVVGVRGGAELIWANGTEQLAQVIHLGSAS